MALSASSMQWINQQGGLFTRVVIEGEVAVAYKLVPANCWHNGKRFPHEVEKDIRGQSFKSTEVEGLDYLLIPDSTTNSRGQVAHYGQAHTESVQPSEVRDAQPPPAVQKYLKTEKRVVRRMG